MNLQSTYDVSLCVFALTLLLPWVGASEKTVKQFVSPITVPECTRDQPKCMIWHRMCCKR